MDCEPAALADCYKGAATCADYFWTLCFDRWVVFVCMCACSVPLGMGGQQAGRAQAQQGIVLKQQRLLAAARLTAFNLSTPP